VLRRDDRTRGRGDEEVPRMMEKVLLEKGVSPENIHIIPLEPAAVDFALSMGETDDLLLIFGDNCTRTWKQIINFNDKADGESSSVAEASTSSGGQPSLIADALTEADGEIITDSRGVRLARIQEED
jgi:cyanophycin synthetase